LLRGNLVDTNYSADILPGKLFSSLKLQIPCKRKIRMDVCLAGDILHDKPTIHLELILKFAFPSFSGLQM